MPLPAIPVDPGATCSERVGGPLGLVPGREAAAPLPETPETSPFGAGRKLLLLLFLAGQAPQNKSRRLQRRLPELPPHQKNFSLFFWRRSKSWQILAALLPRAANFFRGSSLTNSNQKCLAFLSIIDTGINTAGTRQAHRRSGAAGRPVGGVHMHATQKNISATRQNARTRP